MKADSVVPRQIPETKGELPGSTPALKVRNADGQNRESECRSVDRHHHSIRSARIGENPRQRERG